MSDLVTLDVSDGVADVRLNRADKHNALSVEMFEAIVAMIDRLRSLPAARVVVLSGNGPSFCAGLDTGLFAGMAGGSPGGAMQTLLRRDSGPDNVAQRVAYGWKTLPVPVIAALHGTAVGGGFQIALGSDIRVAAPDARFSIMETRYGLVPDMSITQTLPELLPRDKALELTLTARVFGGEEAARLGLVTCLDAEPLERALTLAREIAQRSPDAVRAVKRLYNESWRASAEHGLRLEEALQLPLIGAPNQIEAVKAALERREPRFIDPQTAAG